MTPRWGLWLVISLEEQLRSLMIASNALVHDALLLSANLRDFSKVPDLRVENWLT